MLPLYLPYCQRHCGYSTCAYLREKNIKPFKLFCVYNYFDDFPFYLNQTVSVVDFIPEEHTLGLKTEPCDRYMTMSKFKEHWAKDEICHAVVSRGNERRFERQMQKQNMCQLHQDTFFTLYGNK